MTDSKLHTNNKSLSNLFGLGSKNIVVILIVLFTGGGGVAALDFCTEADVKGYLEDAKKIEDQRHTDIDKKFDSQNRRIQAIGKTIDSVKQTQIREIARQEARRLTKGMKYGKNREETYERILLTNIKRLERGWDPCMSTNCESI